MATKKLKVTVVNSTHTTGGRLFRVGDEVEVTEAEFERFPGKFKLRGNAPAERELKTTPAAKKASEPKDDAKAKGK